MAGIIAIVGRPNVGKSALFNRIAGRRIAIVHDQPGVTRDRVSAEVEWQGRPFTLVDTGGIGLLRGEKAQDVISQAAIEQVNLAIEAAQVIIFVLDIQHGLVPLDQEVADRLRRSGKPIILAVNKADTAVTESGVGDFERLGFDRVFPVSASHNRGITALMGAAMAALPHEELTAVGTAAAAPPLKLAIVGRPNVGKSSIINALTRVKRVIVSPIPGTTRDSVDVPFEIETEGVRQQYVLIDTAGIRKTRSVDDSIEFFSVKRAEDSIERCDICVFVLDAKDGITEQDKKIGGRILEARKACVVVVNKWDLFEEAVEKSRDRQQALKTKGAAEAKAQPTNLGEFGDWVQRTLFFLDYAPVIFTSAQSGFHLPRLLEAVRFVAAQLQQKIPTALLNRTINDAIETRQPISAAGHRLKFFYATQVAQKPPTFLLFVNRDELFSSHYQKYLAGRLRQAFGYEGCPIILCPKPRPKKIESIRTNKTSTVNPRIGRDRNRRPTRRSRSPGRGRG